ncbi:hypothetical protein PTSG_03380 [Salpingoeca rosetta]|uniref:Uncharacterized protein n=1 Tax=Salpingoeca rosetta (strain ATCC 50818 / BSB-021) TaxID=946362 RepID=F2U515_SALR5|nr:uncharacterized protein PTSG_03380 [Salpingoeca rosetta]EGD82731.1 hypothetical protein PTSG_03380 [Salpingoeca rosetta]|eukprot:XP_004995967.1 hypothetical protein PTSG_03380 [Salpingoeca rosetta]
MGVPGLINLVRPVVQTVNLERFTGQRVAIDISSFAYKGCYSRSLELLRNAEDLRPYRFVFKRLALLTTAGITPVVVFDGAPLAAKAEENARRQRQRKAAREEALKLRKQGKVHEARKASRRALHVSRDMQRTLMAMLDRLNIEYVVAPYEADAQLAFMARTGRVAAVLSDDSDMLCFGVPHVLRNLRSSGTCDSIQFHHLQELTLTRYGVRLSLRDLRLDTLQLAAVLSGCDYLPKHSGAHIHGIGMRTAMYVTHKYKTYTDIMQHLRQNYIITDDLDAKVRHAMLAFTCQVVWDDTAQARRRLPPLAPEPADDDGDSAHPATTPLFEFTSDPANEGRTVAGVVHVENAVERARGRADPDTGHTCHRVRLRPALKAIVSDMRNGRLETTSHRSRRPGRKPRDHNGRDDCGKSTKRGKRGQKRRGQDQNKNPRVAVLMPFKRLGVELERSKVCWADEVHCNHGTLPAHSAHCGTTPPGNPLHSGGLAQTTRKEIVERKVAFREARSVPKASKTLKKKKEEEGPQEVPSGVAV